MKKVLLRDIVIPAGTIFHDAPIRTHREPGAYLQATIGLTKDTAGAIEYEVSPDVDAWFKEVS